jgi:hypothetical protein
MVRIRPPAMAALEMQMPLPTRSVPSDSAVKAVAGMSARRVTMPRSTASRSKL